MWRITGFVAAMLASVAFAAEPLATLSPEKRAEIVKSLRDSHETQLKDAAKAIDDARALYANPKTRKGAEEQLRQSVARHAAIERSPIASLDLPKISDVSKEGSAGRLASSTLAVIESDDERTVADMAYRGGGIVTSDGKILAGGNRIGRVALVPKSKKAKPKATIVESGLWVAGPSVKIDGRDVRILYRLEVKDEELSGKPEKK